MLIREATRSCAKRKQAFRTPSCPFAWQLRGCVNDFVEPRLAQVSEQAAVLRRKSGRTTKDEKELERLTDLEQELREFRAEPLRVAAFWKPNLNDRVQISAAPLWKLFAHKPWQKRLKETWEKLDAGEYDGAHVS